MPGSDFSVTSWTYSPASDGPYQFDAMKQDHLAFAFLPRFLEIPTGTKKVVFTAASVKVISCQIF